MTTIRPHELTPGHVNRRVRVEQRRTAIEGRLGPFQHTRNWIDDQRLCDPDSQVAPGPVETAFTVGHIRLAAHQSDDTTIEILEETA